MMVKGEHEARTNGALDGATFPHIIKAQYAIDGTTYTKRKGIGADKAKIL